MLTYRVSYTYLIFVMRHSSFQGIHGVMDRRLDCRAKRHGFESCPVNIKFWFNYLNRNYEIAVCVFLNNTVERSAKFGVILTNTR